MKKLLCLALTFAMLFTVPIGIYANEALDSVGATEEIELEHLILEEELLILEEESAYNDRFIVKYKTGSNDARLENISRRAFEYAVSKKSERNAQRLERFKDADSKMLDRLKEPERGSLRNSRNRSSVSIEDSRINQGNIAVIELNEAVNPQEFVEQIIAEMNDEIEYIQPDVIMELSNVPNVVVLEIDGDTPENTKSVTIPEVNEDETDSKDKIDNKDTSSKPDSNVASDDEINDSDGDKLSDEPDNEVSDANDDAFTLNTTNLTDVTVAIIDTGVDVNHPSLIDRAIDGWDFFNNTSNIFNLELGAEQNHGTHIAGIIAETAPNAKIMPLKVFENGRAYTSDIIAAIEYAEANGASIVNASWGSTDNNQALKEAMESSSLFFVCAAGNNRLNIDEIPIYPAAFNLPNTISVASVNQDLGMSYFSNYGSVDIAAIGRDVESAIVDGEFGSMTGTSMAAAYVTAGATLGNNEQLMVNNQDLKTILLDSADKLSSLRGKVTNGNYLNIENILDGATGQARTVSPEDDWDRWVERTPDENWELFNAVPNKEVAAGSSHTVVLKQDGTVWAFGYNNKGQLGNGTMNNNGNPVPVIGLPNNIIQIDAMEHRSVALTSGGTVYNWGNGRSTPMLVSGLSGIDKITCGIDASMALDRDCTFNTSRVWTFDGNNPTVVTGLPGNVIDISSGGRHYAALLSDKQVMTWGRNDFGELGRNGTISSSVPDYVPNMNNVDELLTGGNFMVVIKNVNNRKEAYGWGHRSYCQMGERSYSDDSTPRRIFAEIEIDKIYVGYYHTLITDINGYVYSTGYNNYSQLGLGFAGGICPTQKVEDLRDIVNAGMGLHHTIIVSHDGRIAGFGDNMYGQLGVGESVVSKGLIELKGLSNIRSVTAGQYNSFAISSDNAVDFTNSIVYAWGDNMYGQLGDGTKEYQTTPVRVRIDNADFKGAKKIAAAMNHTVALKEDGSVWAWGNNGSGQLGINSTTSSIKPVRIQQSSFHGKLIVDIACGENHTLALAEDGSLYAWGVNSNGQLGNNTLTNSKSPIPVSIGNVSKIAAGDSHSVAIMKDDNTLRTWGVNSVGQLGSGNYDRRIMPDTILDHANTEFKEIAAGAHTTYAVKTDGTVLGFGTNNGGCLGADGVGNNTNKAKPITPLSDIKSISYGIYHGVAMNENNSVFIWGQDAYGQLCGLTYQHGAVPALEGADIVQAGRYHGIALLNGKVYTWGSNDRGQLGNGYLLIVGKPLYSDSGVNHFYGTNFSGARLITSDKIRSSIEKVNEGPYFKFIAPETTNYTFNTIVDEPFELTALGMEIFDTDTNSKPNAANGSYALDKGSTYYIKVTNTTNNTGIHYTLTINRNISVTETITCSKNDEMYLVLTGNNIPAFSGTVFKLSFNSTHFTIVDGATMTPAVDKTLGKVPGTNITIKEISAGSLSFSIDRAVPNSKTYSGVLNVIKLQAKKSGSHSITVSR